jgi:tRNA (guanine10-N2)-dimethyltransferase
MKKLFYLTGDHVEFAKQEVIALTDTKDFEHIGRILITDTDLNLGNRLALTHSIHQFLFKCKHDKLLEQMKSFDWSSVYEKDFCVRIVNLSEKRLISKEKELASIIWHSLEDSVNLVNKDKKNSIKNLKKATKIKPVVNLTNSNTNIQLFVTDKEVFVCKKLEDVDKSFFDRWPHKRPCFYPTSITSKLARACINLSGIKKGTLLDPFCGIGAILIEAGLMNMKVIGSDLSAKKVRMCKVNLDYYNVKDYELFEQDALDLPKNKYDCIVTDPPYDKNEKINQSLDSFYKSFLKSAYNSLTSKGVMVIICPDKINLDSINPGFKVKTEVRWFIHGSLTRHIIALAKN